MGFWIIINTYLASTGTGGVPISAFAPLVGIPVGVKSSEVGFKISIIAAGIKHYKLISKKKKKKDKIALLAKSKFSSIEVLNSNALIDCTIRHDEFVI